MLKITKIEATRVKTPFNTKYVTGTGTVSQSDFVIVRVQTNDPNIYGLGEACPYPVKFQEETCTSVMGVLEEILGPVCLGEDPLNINYINILMDNTIPGNLNAKASIDIALWDIYGKVCNLPVYQLLGGKVRNEVDLLWPLSDQTPDEDATQVAQKISEGFTTYMLKMGSYTDISMEIERIRRLKAEYKNMLHIIPDANQAWTIDQAAEFIQGVEYMSGGVDFIEQPLHKSNPQASIDLQKSTRLPLSIDESLQTPYDARLFASSGGARVFSVKVVKNGGISKSREIVNLAKHFGISCLFNSMLEGGIAQAAGLHLCLATPNITMGGHCFMSTLRLRDVTNFKDTFIHRVKPTNENVEVMPVRLVARPPNNGPGNTVSGLGIELIPDEVSRYTERRIEISVDLPESVSPKVALYKHE